MIGGIGVMKGDTRSVDYGSCSFPNCKETGMQDWVPQS